MVIRYWLSVKGEAANPFSAPWRAFRIQVDQARGGLGSILKGLSIWLTSDHMGLFTIEVCDVVPVAGPQAVVQGVSCWAQIVRPHDGAAVRGVGQAQGVAQLMYQHGEQVRPLQLCTRGERGPPSGR